MGATAIGTIVLEVAANLLHDGFPVLHLGHLGHLVHLGQLGQGGAGLHCADDGKEDQKSQSCDKGQKLNFKTLKI